jgi:hypothetical protein
MLIRIELEVKVDDEELLACDSIQEVVTLIKLKAEDHISDPRSKYWLNKSDIKKLAMVYSDLIDFVD